MSDRQSNVVSNKLKDFFKKSPTILDKFIKNKKIAVDGSLLLHKVLYGYRTFETGAYFTNSDGEITSHIYGLMSKLSPFLANNVKIIFVVDGAQNPLKSELIKTRRAATKLKLQISDIP